MHRRQRAADGDEQHPADGTQGDQHRVPALAGAAVAEGGPGAVEEDQRQTVGQSAHQTEQQRGDPGAGAAGQVANALSGAREGPARVGRMVGHKRDQQIDADGERQQQAALQ